jgi:hypothetical protein
VCVFVSDCVCVCDLRVGAYLLQEQKKDRVYVCMCACVCVCVCVCVYVCVVYECGRTCCKKKNTDKKRHKKGPAARAPCPNTGAALIN